MYSLEPIQYDKADSNVKEIFDQFKKKMGRVPNIYAVMAHSLASLKGLLSLKGALDSGKLSKKEAEAISLVVGEVNQCEYCLAAHTAIAKMVGIPAPEALLLRQAQSNDPKLQALVGLAKEIVSTQGRPDPAVVEAFFSAGYDQEALVEVIANVALNIFTNYFNHIAEPKVDFPKPE
ncbi:MAG TPA: carboxymuconolactone decarboxylase family protein [Candidatus Bathyarchaeia archaeon]|nr:carboxymuconolactone decarboxylase family protein [Candidatus Bathyarchaeia archaeon]